VAVLQATETVAARIPVLSATTGLDIRAMPRMEYGDLMRLIGSARAMVSLTVNDGLPSILVEAMALGALPLHSDLDPVREWVRDGENGLLLPPEDADTVARALVRAVEDDALVDRAAQENERLVRQRLDYADVRRRAIEMYERVAGGGGGR
jgi:glycosyltransferase involved in cell wall biosynthesis